MKVHTDLNNFNVHKPVVTIGTFDGIHKGHYEIISRLIKLTKKVHGESVVFTLWPHPRIVINPDNANLKLLNTLDEKIELLEKSGVEHLIIYPFTKEFSQLSSYDFIKDILVNQIGVKFLVFGYDHQFGRNREGKFKNLIEYANLFGFEIEKIDALNVDKINVSSTKIRNALSAGNIALANKYLGYNYFIKGIVGDGSKIGRSLGFPTANLIVQDKYKLIPADGVYAVEVRINNNYYKGILNIGIRPTIKDNSKDKSIEVHILDFNENIYNKEITIIFKKKIRDEQKFDSIELLKKQLLSDKEEALSILAMF